MSKKLKNIFNILTIVVCSAAVIFVIIQNDIVAVFKEMRNAKWIFLFFGICLQLCMVLLDSASLTCLTRRFKKDYTFKDGLTNYLVGLMFCYVTPSSSGGQFAQVRVFKDQKVQPHKSLSILLINFLGLQISAVLLGIIAFVINRGYISSDINIVQVFGRNFKLTTLAIFGLIINIVVGFGLFFLSYSRIVNDLVKLIIKILHKIRIIKDYDGTLKRIEDRVQSFKDNLNELKHMKNRFLLLIILESLKFSLKFFIPVLIALGFGITLTLDKVILIMCLSSYLYLISSFIPTPGSSGGAELFFALLFTPIYGTAALTTSAMLLWRLITFYIPLLYTFVITMLYNNSSKTKAIDFVPNKHMWFFYHNFKQEHSLTDDYSSNNTNEEDADEGYY